MVEQGRHLDAVFGSLSDPTRRDILKRVARQRMTIGEIAAHYPVSFAAIAKHLTVLEHAGLVVKTRQGREQLVALSPSALADASAWLEKYRDLWEKRLDRLDRYVNTINKRKGER